MTEMANSRETRITVESTAVNPAILVLNTPYLYRNKYGILKSLIFVLSLIIFVLLLMFKFKYENRFLFLLLINFSHLYVITLMIGCCLFSLTTATLLTKIIFDFVFHTFGFILYLIAGIWILVQDIQNNPDDNQMLVKIFAACSLIVSFIHLAHGILSYRSHIA